MCRLHANLHFTAIMAAGGGGGYEGFIGVIAVIEGQNCITPQAVYNMLRKNSLHSRAVNTKSICQPGSVDAAPNPGCCVKCGSAVSFLAVTLDRPIQCCKCLVQEASSS